MTKDDDRGSEWTKKGIAFALVIGTVSGTLGNVFGDGITRHLPGSTTVSVAAAQSAGPDSHLLTVVAYAVGAIASIWLMTFLTTVVDVVMHVVEWVGNALDISEWFT